jgi:hypothetical protein
MPVSDRTILSQRVAVVWEIFSSGFICVGQGEVSSTGIEVEKEKEKERVILITIGKLIEITVLQRERNEREREEEKEMKKNNKFNRTTLTKIRVSRDNVSLFYYIYIILYFLLTFSLLFFIG